MPQHPAHAIEPPTQRGLPAHLRARPASAAPWRAAALLLLCLLLSAAAGSTVRADLAFALSEPGFTLLYALDLPVSADFNTVAPAYEVDRSAELAGPFDRVAYRLSLTAADGTAQRLWVSMDPFVEDLGRLGLPAAASGMAYAGPARNLTVLADAPGLPAEAQLPEGWLELWPGDYATANAAGAPGASDTAYDWGDAPTGGGQYGSFQLHDSAGGRTLLAYNHWGQALGAASDIGIGPAPGGHPDWTFAGNAAAWSSRHLEVWIRSQAEPSDRIISRPQPYAVYQRDDQDLAMVPVAGDFGQAVGPVEVRAVELSPPGRNLDWLVLDGAPADGRFAGRVLLPSGWWRLELRASRQDAAGLALARLQPLGVGETFLVAGQSNSANHGQPPLRPGDPRVAAPLADGSGWRRADDPQPVATGGGGSPWPAMGDALAAALDLPVGLVSVGWGGTAVAQWEPGGTLYPRLGAALEVLRQTGGPRALLWHQGETDAMAGTSAEVYAASLVRIIAQTRRDAGGLLPWWIAQVSFVPGLAEAPREAVLEGQRRVVAGQVQVFAGPLTDDLVGAEWRFDGIHFGRAGLVEHGRRWAQALLASGLLPRRLPEPAPSPSPSAAASAEPTPIPTADATAPKPTATASGTEPPTPTPAEPGATSPPPPFPSPTSPARRCYLPHLSRSVDNPAP